MAQPSSWFTAAGKYRDCPENPAAIYSPVITKAIADRSQGWSKQAGSWELGWFRIKLNNEDTWTAGEIADFRNMGAKRVSEGSPVFNQLDLYDSYYSDFSPIPTPTPTPVSSPTPTPT